MRKFRINEVLNKIKYKKKLPITDTHKGKIEEEKVELINCGK